MAFGLGTLAGIGGALIGGSQAKKAADRANRGNIAAKNAARGEIIGGRDAYMRQAGLSLANYLDMLKEAGTGEAKAAGEVTRGTSQAARGIMDQQRQTLAGLGGQFASQGLYGSSLLNQAQMGVQRSGQQSLADLYGSSAMNRAQLARDSSASKMNALGQLGAFNERRAGTLYDSGKQLANLEAGVQHVVDPNAGNMWGQVAGLLSEPLNSLFSFGNKD